MITKETIVSADQAGFISFSEPGPISAKINRLPPQPAIYTFIREVTISRNQQPKTLLDHIIKISKEPHGPKYCYPISPYETAVVHNESSMVSTYLKGDDDTLKLLEDQSFRDCIYDVLETMQQLAPPLYIGETGNLQRRIQEHLNGETDLKDRLLEESIDIERLALRYFLLTNYYRDNSVDTDDDAEEDDDDTAEIVGALFQQVPMALSSSENNKRKLLEELVTRITKPRFIGKLGSRAIPLYNKKLDLED